MGDKIDWVMRHAKLVWVGNPYLKSRAELAGARQIRLLPTVIDPSRYPQKVYYEKEKVTIGWIGSPSTLKYVKLILPALEELNREFDIELILVNGKKGVAFSGEQVLIPWSEETEVASIHQMDIGMMPLPDDSWERGKCAYKLIQYMACGLPVVASPVGMNPEVVQHGENGFLAASEAEWVEYLGRLISDASLRKAMGERGRRLVMERYTLERNFEMMEDAVWEMMLGE
jgi:glycosyltransferase involved in cell wall biosynthesis